MVMVQLLLLLWGRASNAKHSDDASFAERIDDNEDDDVQNMRANNMRGSAEEKVGYAKTEKEPQNWRERSSNANLDRNRSKRM